MSSFNPKPRFHSGHVLATPGALLALERSGDSLSALIRRHECGDWGETCTEDARMNENAIGHGGRMFSVYILRNGIKLWIITEADRAATTALLPEEY